MDKTNQFSEDLYTEAQWQWVEAKYREGYYISQLAEFLGITRETLRRIFQRRGIRPVSHDEMTPLSEFRREFYALGNVDGGKA